MSNQSRVYWQAGDIILNLYKVIGVLSQGEFGEVYRVHHLGWNLDLEAKSPKPSIVTAIGGAAALVNRVETWCNLELSPHLVSSYYLRYSGETPLIFTDHVTGGSLQQAIHSQRLYDGSATASLRRILDLAIQMAWGLHAVHQQGVIHQNLTPDTVMLTANGIAKLTDIGLSPAPITYRSPEQASQDALSPSTDLWGWGLTVLAMFAGERMWTSGLLAAQALNHYLETGAKEAKIPRMPVAVAQLLQRCFQENPADRPTSQQVANDLQAIYQAVTGSPYGRSAPTSAQTAADHLNNRAVAAWDLGQPEAALRLWGQALSEQPQHRESIYNRGLMLWRSGSLSDEDLLHQLEATRQPNDWQVDYLLSLVHLERGDYATALRLLQGLQAQDIQQEEVTAALTAAQERQPYTKRLLPEFSQRVSAFQRSTSQAIASLALSPNSRFAVCGGDDQTIRLWEISSGRCLCTFRGHQGQVTAVTLTPDGSQLLSGSADRTMKLWNVASTSHRFTFGGQPEDRGLWDRMKQLLDKEPPRSSGNGHKGTVRSVAVSPDRRYILSGSDDRTVKLWDATTGACLKTLKGHAGPVFQVSFSPNGRYLLSASDDRSIKLWDATSGEVLQTFAEHQQLTCAAYSPDGQYLVAGDQPMKLWEINTGQVVQSFDEPSGVQAVVFSPDQRFLLSGSQDGRLRLWELSTGRNLRTFEPHEAGIRSLALSSDGQYALSTDAHSLKLWSMHCTALLDRAPLRVVAAPSAETTSGDQHLYEQLLAQAQAALEQGDAVSAAQQIRKARSQPGYHRGLEAVQTWLNLYSALPRQSLHGSWEQAALERHTAAIQTVAFSPDAAYALSGSADTTLKLWDVAQERCVLSLEEHTGAVNAIAFSPDGVYALSGSADHTLKLWDVQTGECQRHLQGHTGAVRSVAYSPRGRYALSASDDQTLRLWDVMTGVCLRTLHRHRDRVMAVQFSPDGRHGLSGGADKGIYLWDIATGNCLRTFEGHIASVYAVAFSPDGRYALSGSEDYSLKLWLISTGECVRTLTGHQGTVRSVAFSPDGRYVLSGGDDQLLKLWAVSTGECVRTITGHQATVRSVAFSPDGRYALSGDDDPALKLWLLDWELTERSPANWDEGATPYLETFLTLRTPTATLPSTYEPSAAELVQALTPQGTPAWSETDFAQLIRTLQWAGYGWLRPEGVRQQLLHLTRTAVQATPVAEFTVFPTEVATAFSTEFATEFATEFVDAEPLVRVILTVTEGTLKGEEFVFSDRTVCLIGRAKDCHLQLPNDENHKTVSRYHCLLDINPPAIRIRDLGSLHGTFVNGQMIGRRLPNQTPEQGMQINFPGHDLGNGDEIKLGKTVLRVTIDAPDSAAMPVAPSALEDQTAFFDRRTLSAVSPELALPTIAGYTSLRLLSSDSLHSSYLAQNAQTQDLVTIKLLQPQRAIQPSGIDAFLQAIEAIKTLQHPNLVRVLESGYADGTFFFVSAYSEGETLETAVQQRGRFSPPTAVSIALQLLDGLHYAHSLELPRPSAPPFEPSPGLVHGHLQPANVLLTQAGQVVKMADYGLAKAIDQAGLSGFATDVALPAYMPRQQAIDFKFDQPSVDIWAVAACLYYMLTGTSPRTFSGKDPYLVLLQTTPVPIRERNTSVPAALAELIDLALVDNPDIYFKTAAAFKRSLSSLVL